MMRAWKDCPVCKGTNRVEVGRTGNGVLDDGYMDDCPTCQAHFMPLDKVTRVMLMFKNVAGKADNIYRDRYNEACMAEGALWVESLDPDQKIRLCEAKRALWTGVQVAGMIKESHKTAEGIRVITDLEIDSISLVTNPPNKDCVLKTVDTGKHCGNCGRDTDHGFYPPCDLDKPVRYECRGGGMNQHPKWHMWIPEEKS